MKIRCRTDVEPSSKLKIKPQFTSKKGHFLDRVCLDALVLSINSTIFSLDFFLD